MRTRMVLLTTLAVAATLLGGCKSETYDGPRAIMVTSEPTGASVSLDGKESGYTPLRLEVEPAQNHTIRLSYPGRHTVRAEISRAYNSWNYPGGGTAFTLYAAGSSAACAPLTAIVLSPLIGADIVYAVPYLLRSAQAEPLPPEVHAVLPLIKDGEKARVIDWKDEGRGERQSALAQETDIAGPRAPALPGKPGPVPTAPAGAAVVASPAPPQARADIPLPVYHPRVTP